MTRRSQFGGAINAIKTVIIPRARGRVNLEVRRALPSVARQMIGPLIFFVQFGPAELLTGQTKDVRPHPHIGSGTVTYMRQGRTYYRDSL